MPKKNDKQRKKVKKDTALEPDPETLHTTDPQEKMEGPISSIVQNIKETAEESESKEKADRKKQRNT